MIKQTGLIIESKPKDWVAGVSSPIVWDILLPDGNWIPYKPIDEKQFVDFVFDTMSCATFSALNDLEHILNFLMDKMTVAQLEEVNKLGYISLGKFNFSDRFTAIMSGTTDKGNSAQNVWDSIRKDGVLPEKDLPMGGKTTLEYLNPSVITKEMKDKAKKFLDIMEVMYEFTPTDDSMNEALKCSPLNVAIPKIDPTHAVMLPKMDFIYDTYPPFLYKRNNDIAYAIKVKVTIKKGEPKYTYFNTKTDPKMIGVSDDLMIRLDAIRSECGFPLKITSGYRTPAYNATLKDAVIDSAHTLGLAVDLYCIDSAKRFAIIKSALKNDINRIGISPTFVHLDIDPSKPQNVFWLY